MRYCHGVRSVSWLVALLIRSWLLIVLVASAARGDGLPEVGPRAAGFEPWLSDRIDEAVNRAIAEKKIPGAVVLIGRDGKIAHWRGYGVRSRHVGGFEPMTRETIFDLASLTKPIATASTMLAAIDRGLFRLDTRPAALFPEFDCGGKHEITIEQLLRHRSGLIADNLIADYHDGPTRAWEQIAALSVESPPGTKFRYSDVGYIVLGRMFDRLDRAAADSIFEPLGMRRTGFLTVGKPEARGLAVPVFLWPGSYPIALPAFADLKSLVVGPKDSLGRPIANWRFAPTEGTGAGGKPLRGVVHDPRARALGGVAGHAGLFAPADDIALFAQMMLDGGKARDGTVVLKSETVADMIDPGDTPAGERRGLGWDIETVYSSPRGKEFGARSFGHTGFTGTSLWIDLDSRTFVILLTSRLYPDGKGASPTALRSEVATIVGESLVDRPTRPVLCGIDVLGRDGFALLKGKRVGLVTNHTGRTRDGRSTIDVLFQAEGVKLVALFSPEHGLRGLVDREVADDRDEKTGLPIFSLYGKTRKPTAESLRGVDVLVYDIQDIGTRYYTYISTLGLCLESAAESKIPMVVLDRPNPIGGGLIGGPVRDDEFASFVAHHAMPVRHGMTTGEVAGMFVAERKIDAELRVIPCEGWRRWDLFDRTGLVWVNPSPNMRSLTEAMLYPGVGLLESTNLATGRGTDTPFEKVGAPWIDPARWSAALNELKLGGVRFVPIRFTPKERQFAGAECGGVEIVVTDRAVFDPIALGFGLAATLHRLYPADWKDDGFLKMLADRRVYEAMRGGADVSNMTDRCASELEAFRALRRKYLLYR